MPDMQTRPLERDYSRISRRIIDGRSVYEKRCLPGGRYDTAELVRAQVRREATLLTRLADLPGLGERLGVLQLQHHDPANALISTYEVPGKLLEEVMQAATIKQHRTCCVRGMFLAGRWIRRLQALPVEPSAPHGTRRNPEDLVEHCQLRLNRLAELGCRWPTAEVGRRILDWVGRQVEDSPPEHRRRVLCHGDYGPYNMIWDGRTLTPIDFGGFATDVPLADVAYLIHRVRMLSVSAPWKRWPIDLWQKACLKGYGLADAHRSPMYQALTVRFLLSRMKKLAERQPKTNREWLRDQWVNRQVRRILLRSIAGGPAGE